MITYRYGEPEASTVLIQPVDEHDLSGIENELQYIRELTDKPFCLIAVKVEDWNRDLSPWAAPAVFGNEGFGDGAEDTLREIMTLIDDREKTYLLGGYSLAGLFALWAVFQTDVFSGAAAASPSMWFPGFLDYMREHSCRCGAVYLSLGDKEAKTRNHVMSTVEAGTREGYELLKVNGTETTLEWNKGNHFKEPDLRTARAFAWVIQNGLPGARIKRITEMEVRLNRVKSWLRNKSGDVFEDICILDKYYHSPLWMSDFVADEAGNLPADLPRGVLSEDGIDNVLEAKALALDVSDDEQ